MIAIASRQASTGTTRRARPSVAWYPATAAGMAKNSAIAARASGDGRVAKANRPQLKVMALATAATMTAATSPDPL